MAQNLVHLTLKPYLFLDLPWLFVNRLHLRKFPELGLGMETENESGSPRGALSLQKSGSSFLQESLIDWITTRQSYPHPLPTAFLSTSLAEMKLRNRKAQRAGSLGREGPQDNPPNKDYS